MNISDEAVEAAVDALVMTRMGDFNIDMPSFRTAARQVLEAAVPHLMAAAWEQGRVDGYHHRPNPYKEAGEDEKRRKYDALDAIRELGSDDPDENPYRSAGAGE